MITSVERWLSEKSPDEKRYREAFNEYQTLSVKFFKKLEGFRGVSKEEQLSSVCESEDYKKIVRIVEAFDNLKLSDYHRIGALGIQSMIFSFADPDKAKGKSEEIISIYERAIKAYPKDYHFLILVCPYLSSIGQKEKAISYLELALELKPDDGIYKGVGTEMNSDRKIEAKIAELRRSK
jgi:tetratricopeptide (TPR) repeat protein